MERSRTEHWGSIVLNFAECGLSRVGDLPPHGHECLPGGHQLGDHALPSVMRLSAQQPRSRASHIPARSYDRASCLANPSADELGTCRARNLRWVKRSPVLSERTGRRGRGGSGADFLTRHRITWSIGALILLLCARITSSPASLRACATTSGGAHRSCVLLMSPGAAVCGLPRPSSPAYALIRALTSAGTGELGSLS